MVLALDGLLYVCNKDVLFAFLVIRALPPVDRLSSSPFSLTITLDEMLFSSFTRGTSLNTSRSQGLSPSLLISWYAPP